MKLGSCNFQPYRCEYFNIEQIGIFMPFEVV